MQKRADAAHICFGLSHENDIASLTAYLQLVGRSEFASTLASRLSIEEINELVDLISRLMRDHLSEKEYHELFLQRSVEQQ